jgi:DNA polymerase III epsilon subunit-like protein
MAVNGITFAQVKDAPPLRKALQQLIKTFGTNVILTVYAGNLDVVFFTAAFRSQNLRYPFDYHTFDIWSLCYHYMSRKGKLTERPKFAGFSMESVAKHFRIRMPKHRHQALIDCQLEAEILRAIVKAK